MSYRETERFVEERLGADKLSRAQRDQAQGLASDLVHAAFEIAFLFERHGAVVGLEDLPKLLAEPLSIALKARRGWGRTEPSVWGDSRKAA